MPNDKPKSWRDVLPIHPAAELFDPMSEAELRKLGADIKAKGLRTPITIYYEKPHPDQPLQYSLLDGVSRLIAMELAGLAPKLEFSRKHGLWLLSFTGFETWQTPMPVHVGEDPYDYVISVNLHRRHLTAEQKRDLIAKVLKAKPKKSNRQVAKIVGVSHPHVAKVREQLEQAGDVETVTTSIDTKGRKQPARKKRRDADDFVAERKAREQAREIADPAEEQSRQPQRVAEQVQKAAQVVAMPKQSEQEMPPNDVESAETAAAQFLHKLEDLVEEFEQITNKMRVLVRRLYDSADMRVANFIRRPDPEHPFSSDKPQALIAEIACALNQESYVRSAIKSLDEILSRVLDLASPAPPQPSTPADAADDDPIPGFLEPPP
jgi:hypothetical protein